MYQKLGIRTLHEQCLKVCKQASYTADLRIAFASVTMFMFRLALAQEYTTERVKLEAMRDKMVVDMEKKGINPKVCFWGVSYIKKQLQPSSVYRIRMYTPFVALSYTPSSCSLPSIARTPGV